jgi:hypothetical protein
MNRAEVVAKRIAEAGTLYRPAMAKAYAGNCSPRAAIKAQCLACTGYQREAITDCTGYSCALFMFRPYQKES